MKTILSNTNSYLQQSETFRSNSQAVTWTLPVTVYPESNGKSNTGILNDVALLFILSKNPYISLVVCYSANDDFIF